jgi:hypothetical protein
MNTLRENIVRHLRGLVEEKEINEMARPAKFTLEDIRDIAKKYETKAEWGRAQGLDKGTYKYALERRRDYGPFRENPEDFYVWWDKITAHMNGNQYLSLEDIADIAKKYETKPEWEHSENKADRNAYFSAVRAVNTQFDGDSEAYKNWYNNVTSHMAKLVGGHKPKYTEDEISNIAKKYKHKSDWKTGDFSSYDAAHYKKKKSKGDDWFQGLTSHMTPLGGKEKRMIYALEFPNNYVYVGLTNDFDMGIKKHLEDYGVHGKNISPVLRHMEETGHTPTIFKVTDYVDIKEATMLEYETLKQYLNNGWTALNMKPTGSLGGNKFKYTPIQIRDIAKKYETIEDWINHEDDSSAYYTAMRYKKKRFKDDIKGFNEWWNKVTAHMSQ